MDAKVQQVEEGLWYVSWKGNMSWSFMVSSLGEFK